LCLICVQIPADRRSSDVWDPGDPARTGFGWACNLRARLRVWRGMRQSERAREDQFRAYVLQSRGSLLRTATMLAAGNAHEAEDLVQTALLRMYVSWPRIRSDTRDAYARRILVNACLDQRRRPYARHEQNYADVPDAAVEEAAPSDSETAVFRALAELPPRMRAAVILRHLHEASVAETADALGCSEGTVKSQTARGLAQLRAAPVRAGRGTSARAIDDTERSRP
jgi:RNA polymerase sigma-70 factor (sigma-E family)